VLDVQATVADVERAFHVRIGLYRHPTEARVFYAPDREPTLDLALPVLHIAGLDNYVLPFSHLVRGGAAAGQPKSTGSGPGGNFLGSDIRTAYYGGSALAGSGQSLGLFEYAGYNLADVFLEDRSAQRRSDRRRIPQRRHSQLHGQVRRRRTSPRYGGVHLDGTRPQATRRVCRS
jgi:hypothetical protein